MAQDHFAKPSRIIGEEVLDPLGTKLSINTQSTKNLVVIGKILIETV